MLDLFYFRMTVVLLLALTRSQRGRAAVGPLIEAGSFLAKQRMCPIASQPIVALLLQLNQHSGRLCVALEHLVSHVRGVIPSPFALLTWRESVPSASCDLVNC